MMVSPPWATTSRPFSLNSTGIAAWSSFVIAVMLPASRNFLGEILDYTAYRIRGRLSQAANRGVGHGDRKLFQQRLVPARRFHQLERLGGADPAWRALPTGFVSEELDQVPRGGGGLVLVRQDDYRGRTDEAPVLVERVEIERDVAHRIREYATRRAARKVGIELVPGQHAAAVLRDQLFHRDARRGE